MPTLHAQLLASLKLHAGHGTSHTGNAAYLGNAHASYYIANPIKHRIAKEFLKEHASGMSFKEFVTLLNELFAAPSYDEKAMAAMLIGHASRTHRALLTPKHVDAWLSHLIGWAEVDGLCQSNFTTDELLMNWPVWHRMLVALSKSKNISKRRASLVLLTGPIAHSRDPRLAAIAFENIARLQGERDILITKAISWLLRSMVRYHRREVVAYIRANTAPRVAPSTALPAIAVREATRKIKTGRK